MILSIMLAFCLPDGLVSQTLPVDSASTVQITIDANRTIARGFLGLGIEFDPYSEQPSPDRWRTILDRLTYAQPGFLRVMSAGTDYCLGFDEKGGPIYVWAHPNAATQTRLNKLLAILDYAETHKVAVYLGEWSPPHQLGISRPDDPRWARIIADFVRYLTQVRHYTMIRGYIYMNEPNGEWMWPDKRPDFAAWSAGISALRRQLDARGLQDILLAGPDNSGDEAWLARSVRELAPEFGVWESHIYARDAQVLSGGIEAQLLQNGRMIDTTDPNGGGRPRFLAESGLQDGKIDATDQQPRVHDFVYGVLMADYVAQVARAGWLGADAWDLDDAMHTNGHGGLKIWGFWNSSETAEMAPRPWFYTWSLMSRFFPRGARIVFAEQDVTAPFLRVAAAVPAEGRSANSLSILLVNDEEAARSVIVHLRGTQASRFVAYRYFAGERPVDGAELPVAAAALAADEHHALRVEMPSRGVVVLSSADVPRHRSALQ